MKKITLLLVAAFCTLTGYSQYFEGFEGATFPPTGWLVTDNGVGTAFSWERTNQVTTPPTVYEGTYSAFMTRENIGIGNTSQDWLITNQLTVPSNGQLKFFTRSTLAGNQNTLYQIRVSTSANQADLSSYTIVQQFTESELSAVFNIYEEKIINLNPYSNQNVHIAFVMVYTQVGTGINGDRWLVDNVSVVEQCIDPTNQAVSNISLTGATLSWGNPGGATQFEVEVVQVPNAPTGSGTVVSGNSVTTAALGLTLQQSTQYEYYVRAICNPSTNTSLWVGPFTFSTATPGQTCEAPAIIPSIPYVTTDNTSNYGDEYGGSAGTTCGSGNPYLNGNDVFYTFTATNNTPVTITMNPTSAWSGLFVYNSCANVGVSCIAGVANSSTNPRVIVLPVTAGQTYIIAISTWATGAPTQSTGYTLTIVENSCTNFTATYSVLPDCANGNQFFAVANVTNMGTATSVVGTSSEGGDPQSVTAPGTMQFGPYPNGTNVTLNLQNANDINCFSNSPNLTQGFCPATNNLCADAIPIECGTSQSQTTVGATTAGAPTFTCGTGPGSGGLWYSYIGTGDVVTMSLCGSAYDTKIQVFTGSCGTFTCVAGNDDSCGAQSEVQFISTLGTTYYVYVFGFGTAQGIFNLTVNCVPPPPAPANDNCDTATVATVNTDATCAIVSPGTINGATQSPQANTCVGTANDDVWFQFVATQSIHTIALLNIAGSAPNLNHALFTSTNATDPCSNLTLVYCSDPNESYATGLIAGQTYFIRVYSSGALILQNTTFNLCISVPPPPPANDECLTAISVPVNPNTGCTLSTPGTVTSATQSPQANGCPGVANDDVWFSFVATSASHTIDLTNVVGSTTNLNHGLYTGTCDALTQVYCSDPNSSIANNLVIGQTYYVRVFTAGSVLGTVVNFNICIGTIGPPVSVSTTLYTVPELVTDILLNSTCANVSNITWSTGTNFGSTNGIGYFQENGSGFPFEDGIVLISGDATRVPGPNTTSLSDGNQAWVGDADLDAVILAATGQAMNSRNATKIEFDFVPLSPIFKFDFIFASEEYGGFQCSFSDAFAFLLTNVTTGVTTNLAVVPGTSTPISVVTVRNNLYNAGCPSVNPEFFGAFYGANGQNVLAAPIDFNGVTVPMTATTTVIPNQQYKIKIVVADRLDNILDSAVFLKGGSFDIGDLDLGLDFLVDEGSAVCPNDFVIIDTQLPADEFEFIWYLDGEVIPNETGPTLTATVPGVYSVDATLNNSSCAVSDSIIVEFYEGIDPGEPEDLAICSAAQSAVFDLTDNESLLLGPLGPDYTFAYFLTQEDADNNENAITNPTEYTNISNPQTIYVRIIPNVGDCYNTSSFQLLLQDLTPQFTITENQSICEGATTTIEVTPLNFNLSDLVTFTWTLNGNPFPGDTSTITVSEPGVYEVIVAFVGCSSTGTSTLSVFTFPTLDPIPNVTACDSYELPLLTVGNYFTGPGGTGLLLNAGDLISSTQTIFVYTTNGPCATEVSFVVTINSIQASTLPNVTVCDSYVLPTIEVGNFFTEPNGGGTQLAVSTAITTSQTIYIFAQTGTEPNCVSQTSFEVTVNSTPPVDSLSDVTVCDSFELPTLTAGNYYTGPNGSGQALVAGNLITSSQTVYIFAQSNTVPNCTAENSFVVTIDSVSVDQLEDVEQCGSFILPTLSSNNVYFTGPNGSGTQLAAGSLVTSTQTVYIYATSGTCSAGTSFEVVINNCVIPKGISPNGDGLNDVLDLSTFGVEKLSIFNRYGRKVYGRSNYTNQWGGQSDKGDELPDGTYYFVIEFETEPTKTGWIYINRER
jgi:gliding motility-associated-like protein